jgi:chemotaxis protein methyltransferase CheR
MSALRKPSAEADRQLVEGEFPFTLGDFQSIADLLYKQAGITLPEGKATLVYSRLAKRLRELRLASFSDYCALVAREPDGPEAQTMLRALTTNVTRFFREPHHFDHLREHVIAPLAAAARAGRRVRMWSAACSTGQEPYSIALTLLDALPDAASLDIKILGTDIDANVIATARAAVYSDDLVEPIPAAFRSKWMDREPGGGWRVGDAARSLVSFKELNLIRDWPMKGRFDAVFCRNVVIYFDEQTQEGLWRKFAPILSPGGRLYVGHSERVFFPGCPLVSDGLTAYRAPGVLG